MLLHVLPFNGCRISKSSEVVKHKRPIDGRVRYPTVYSINSENFQIKLASRERSRD